MKQSICLVEDPFKIRLTPDSQKLSSYWLIQPISDEFVVLFYYWVVCFFLHLFTSCFCGFILLPIAIVFGYLTCLLNQATGSGKLIGEKYERHLWGEKDTFEPFETFGQKDTFEGVAKEFTLIWENFASTGCWLIV